MPEILYFLRLSAVKKSLTIVRFRALARDKGLVSTDRPHETGQDKTCLKLVSSRPHRCHGQNF